MITEFDTFGGMNRRVKREAIAPDCYDQVNVTNDVEGVLASRPPDDLLSTESGAVLGLHSPYLSGTRYRLKKVGDTLYSDGTSLSSSFGGTSFLRALEYLDMCFMCDGVVNKKWNGTDLQEWGIAPPTVKCSVTSTVAGNLDGTYYYYYAYYNSTTGHRSKISPISDSVTVSSDKVDLSDLAESADTQVSHILVYRIGGTLSTINYVDSIVNGTTVYVDDIADTTVAGQEVLSSTEPEQPPVFWLVERVQNMIYGVTGRLLYYFKPGEPESCPSSYYEDLGETINGLAQYNNELIIFTKSRIIRLVRVGVNPGDFLLQDTFAETGTLSPYACVQTPYGVFYLDAHKRLGVIRGGVFSDIGIKLQPLLDGIKSPELCWGAFYKSRYYMSYCESSGFSTPNKVLVVDCSYPPIGSRISTYDWNANVMHKERESNLFLIGENTGKILIEGIGVEPSYFRTITWDEPCKATRRRKVFKHVVFDINTNGDPVCIQYYTDDNSSNKRVININTTGREKVSKALEASAEGYRLHFDIRYITTEAQAILSDSTEHKTDTTTIVTTGQDTTIEIGLKIYGISVEYEYSSEL